MKNRGRVSAASLSVVQNTGAALRPEPPGELDKQEGNEWRAVVARMPVGWFPRETHALLVQYCRHTTRARMLNEMLAEMQTDKDAGRVFNVKDYNRLLQAEKSVSGVIAMLATKMRMSQQSSYDKSKVRGGDITGSGPKFVS